jgi:hypothetical protein
MQQNHVTFSSLKLKNHQICVLKILETKIVCSGGGGLLLVMFSLLSLA